MHFIIGGAYQGKTTFACNKYSYQPSDVFSCKDAEIDFKFPCITNIENFTLACVKLNKNPIKYFMNHIEEWKESTIICQDLSCGVVPLDAENRIWRQETGKLCQYLAVHANHVSRIFCGLEQVLK